MQVDVVCMDVVAVAIYQLPAETNVGCLPDEGEQVLVGWVGVLRCSYVSMRNEAYGRVSYTKCEQEPATRSANVPARRTERIPVSWCRFQWRPPKSTGCPSTRITISTTKRRQHCTLIRAWGGEDLPRPP